MSQAGPAQPIEQDATSGPPPVEGEFQPYIPAERTDLAELTPRAIVLGVLFGILFGASSVYLALKVGLTVSASIPIAVFSIVILNSGVVRKLSGRKGSILENNIVQTVGSAGESIAAGSVFVIPAIILLGYDLQFPRVALIALTGGVLGVLLMIPLRRALIVKEHGNLRYPEGVACAEVLIAGESRGAQAAMIVQGGLLGIVYKFMNSGLRLWNDIPAKALNFFTGGSVACEVSPELLGVGYIIGYKTSAVMAAGGVLAYLVLIPAIKIFGAMNPAMFHATTLIKDMDPDSVRGAYVLYIGAGAVATGGLISLLRAMPTIVGAFREGLKGFTASKEAAGAVKRTDRDISMRTVLIGAAALAVAIWAIPYFEMTWYSAILVIVFGFFFATVSSRIVGEIGSSSNPISGMTVAALLGTCLFFLAGGKTGITERVVAISVGAIVCIVAANAGATSQDLKTGFLVGSTPRKQQIGILIGAATSALMVGATLILMNLSQTVEINTRTIDAAKGYQKFVVTQQLTETDTAREDGKTYKVLRVLDDTGEIPKGKYFVDGTGHIAYVVDPGIGGHEFEARKEMQAKHLISDWKPFDAPKATLMSYIVDGILQRKLPWDFVLLGVFISLVLELCGVASLPFAVGLYLPLSSSAPIYAGGLARVLVDRIRRRRGEKTAEGDAGKGVLFSSGLIAGGSIGGMLLAIYGILHNFGWVKTSIDLSDKVGWFGQSPGVAMAIFLVMGAALTWVASRPEKA